MTHLPYPWERDIVNYDYEYTNTSKHYISIFEIKTGKVVDHAESVQEALDKIFELERQNDTASLSK